VTHHHDRRPGASQLTPHRVLRHAAAMLRHGFWRVAGVAVLFFVPPALLAELVEEFAERIEPGSDPIMFAILIVGILAVIVLKLLGPVAYAGYLDEAVGHGYFHGSKRSFGDVIRSLPLGRLLVADVMLVVAVTFGLALLVVPGIIIATLFGLVGPVIVQERRGVIDAFKRTYRLSRPAWRLIVLLVVIPIGLENAFEELVLERAHEIHPALEIAAEWLLAVTVGATVGLIEVAIATELMARRPEPPPEPVAVAAPSLA
jgi:hypothetical protein